MKLTTLALVSLFAFAACEEKKPSPPTATPAAATPAATPTPAAEPAAAPTAALAAVTAIPSGTKMKCPVSGEDFTVGAKTAHVTHEGKDYAFCCSDCVGDFKKDPAKYAKK